MSLPHPYTQSLALLTDFYQLTMAYGYWKAGLHNKEAVFHLFFRKCPFHGGFAISAGLETAIRFLENFRYDDSDLSYLSTLKGNDGEKIFDDKFFDYLSKMQFSCDVDAVPEGNAVFPQEPLIRVQGPLIQAQMLESPLLNLINFPSLIATKAARICIAAEGEDVLEFGMRRAQGIDGSLTASRAAFIGGCDSTSNVLAGKLYGIPVRGTHSHSWVMAFDQEIESFETFAKYLPSNTIFLVDTYGTIEGVEKAIQVGKAMRQAGKKMVGIRLDSGDLAYLSIQAREMLDRAGFHDAKIVASNELDETIIGELKRQGAKITVWGVGTNLVTAGNQPALDGVYKLSAIRDDRRSPWKYKLKLSEQIGKISNPGILQVRRFYEREEYIADAIYDTCHPPKDTWSLIDPLDHTRQKIIKKGLLSKDLLVPIFREGKRVYELPTLQDIRKTTIRELGRFHSGVKRFINPHQYIVGMEKNLYDVKLTLIKNIRSHASSFLIPSSELEK